MTGCQQLEDRSAPPAPTALPFDPASQSLITRRGPCFHKGENNCFQPRQRALCAAWGPPGREPVRQEGQPCPW